MRKIVIRSAYFVISLSYQVLLQVLCFPYYVFLLVLVFKDHANIYQAVFWFIVEEYPQKIFL